MIVRELLDKLHINPNKLSSDMFCVDFLPLNNDTSSNTIMYGHRNGHISLHDMRSAMIDSIPYKPKRRNDKYGSVMSISPISNDQPYYILTKGSFGSCHLYDIRQSSSSSKSKSLLHDMNIPLQYKPSTIHTTRCSGIAFHNNVCFTPFVTDDKRLFLSSWSLSNGEFVDCIQLSVDENINNNHSSSLSSSSANNNTQNTYATHSSSTTDINNGTNNPVFCELSKTVTSSISINNNDHDDYSKKSSWGLWLKTSSNVSIDDNHLPPPRELGGIHHIRFS